MPTIYNFNPGPAQLPHEIMLQAQAELLDWQGTGVSILEISHRSTRFMAMAAQAEQDLRELLNIAADYQVLFLAGGASHQFAMIPMNLLRGKTTADYIETGIFSHRAAVEAKPYCTVNIAASGAASDFTTIPALATWQLNPAAAYVHYTANETIAGLEFPWIPETGNVPLVSDMTSNLLSMPLDVSRFGLIYASAQKNIGPSGLTVVIVRNDLVGDALPLTPSLYNYKVQADNNSLYNTPPTFAWYMAGLMFAWLKKQGGLEVMTERNRNKADKLYRFIDQSDFYFNKIDPVYRSRMNVSFTLANAELETLFLIKAAEVGLVGLKGHRVVGGLRASIYNAMPEAGVDALIAFMTEFESKM